MGDSDPELAGRANRFFVRWREMIAGLLHEARQAGRLGPQTDCAALAGLMVSALEGALLMCKAARDGAQLRQTADTLLALLAGQETQPAPGRGGKDD